MNDIKFVVYAGYNKNAKQIEYTYYSNKEYTCKQVKKQFEQWYPWLKVYDTKKYKRSVK